MSDSVIWMTTKLAGENTFFLPFNKGREGHAGNPARADGEYPVALFLGGDLPARRVAAHLPQF